MIATAAAAAFLLLLMHHHRHHHHHGDYTCLYETKTTTMVCTIYLTTTIISRLYVHKKLVQRKHRWTQKNQQKRCSTDF
jgi:hypothetical protein